MMTQMPFAAYGSAITHLLLCLRPGPLSEQQPILRLHVYHVLLQAITNRITPRQQTPARGGARRHDIMLIEPNPAGRKAVDKGRFDVAAVETDVVPTEIISDQKHNVGARRGGRG